MPRKPAKNGDFVETYSRTNRHGMILAGINLVYQESMRCESLQEFGNACLRAVESMTESPVGFIGVIGTDELFHDLVFSHDGERPDARELSDPPPLRDVLSGLPEIVLLKGRSLLTNDPSRHLREGAAPVASFLGVPFVRDGKAVGMVAVANREGGYSRQHRRLLESLTPTIMESLLRKRAEETLRESRAQLAADLSAMTRLHEVSTRMWEEGEFCSLLEHVLDAAIEISSGDKGLLHVINPDSQRLEIKAQRGFTDRSFDSLVVDENDEGPWGQVIRQRSRIVVESIPFSPIYGARSLAVLDDAEIQSIACIPLLGRSGALVGLITTCWRRAHSPEDRVLRSIDLLARQAADFIGRVHTEQELLQSQALLQSVMEGTPDAVYVKDSESRILMCNPAFAGIIGMPIVDILGKTDGECYRDHSIGRILREHDLRVMTSGESEILEETVPGAGGFRILLSAKAPFRNVAGGVVGIIGISHDITERKQMEESLRQARNELELRVAERTAELSQAVSMLNEEVAQRVAIEQNLRERSEQLRLMASELTMAEQRERQRLAQVLHDGLQQVLVGAKYRLALAVRSKDLRRTASEVAELIDDAIETSRSLTAELSPPILAHGGLFAALEWLARWMQDKHGLEVELLACESMEAPKQDLAIFLFQATRELLFNVIKHAGERKAGVRVSRIDDGIEVAVSDEGAGFDPAQLRAAGGCAGGFGLFSISERLALLGGEMRVDSAAGRGTRVSLVAPLEGSAALPGRLGKRLSPSLMEVPSEVSVDGGEAAKKIRILLVDDHMVMRQGLAGLLRSESDMEIVGEASDGSAAVTLTRDLRPDVVLMDITMPGMDGIEATRIIHSEMPHVHVIGLSMFEKGEQELAMRRAGAANYLTKSGPSDAVIDAIRNSMTAP